DITTLVGGVFANNDILLPDESATDNRVVGTHEYGHFLLCNFVKDNNVNNIDAIVTDTVGNLITFGDNTTPSSRYINEAFADYVAGQVVSIANYGWVNGTQVSFGRLCNASPCFDQNFDQWPPYSNPKDVGGIARIGSLIHDAFDGHGQKGADVPD